MSAEEPDKYLAVLKASYDYTPQSDDEIAIKEEQLLLLVERVDEDWWKVKLTGPGHDNEKQIGLIPAAYVEQAQHTSIVKALYGYDAAAPGELTVHEDDILLVYDTEEDWILVQDSQSTGNAGYVPGNYVEVVGEEEGKSSTSQIVVPDSPPMPAYTDPAEKVASAKVSADNIKTWSVAEIDKKGKKKKGTLGVGGGSLFFASETDKTPVQKWQAKDVMAASSEKAKHIQIDIGGSNPATLHFHTGSKENADAILEKLQPHIQGPNKENRSKMTPSASLPKKASVHFSAAAPTIIPDTDEIESPEDNENYEIATALYDFHADGDDELSVKEGDQLTILFKDGDDWWKCRNVLGAEGVVPASYLEIITETGNVTDSKEKGRPVEEGRPHNVEPVPPDGGGQHQIDKSLVVTKAETEINANEAARIIQPSRPRKEVGVPPAASPPQQTAQSDAPKPSTGNKKSSEPNRPSSDQTRIWHDRTGQFRVEAAFLGFNNGKLRLHKINGVIVEVPSEKMSLDDMRYVEKIMEKKRSSSSHRVSDDDIPLAITKNTNKKSSLPSRQAPQIDWFDFFLSAGCDLDDCTRYAAAFERDKIDETLLSDINEGTMRSLGLREGDIIRVKKTIEKRRLSDHSEKPGSNQLQEQIRRDEDLARQLQAQENAMAGRTSAPNLFSGPGGVLKAPRRGRPQPSKSLPPTNVDLNAISSASGQIQSPPSGVPRTLSSSPLARPNSATAVVGGFEDEAWTNRPSSTKPSKSASPAVVSVATSATTTTAAPPQPTSSPPAAMKKQSGPSTLAQTTEADIFDQLARLSDLKKRPASQPSQQTTQNRPAGFQSEMGPPPLSVTPVADSRMSLPTGQPFSGPRGPFAPVPANQSLLQPLIPTQTGFHGFIPTKAASSPPTFPNQVSPPSFIQLQATGFPNHLPILTQATGYGSFGPMPSPQAQNGSLPPLSIQPQPQSFYSHINSPAFALSTAQPSNPVKDTSPASVFAQMKSGTFANEK